MDELAADPSLLIVAGFTLLPMLMLIGYGEVSKSRVTTVVIALWFLSTAWIARLGLLNDFSTMPPRVVLVFLPTIIGVCLIAFSRIGKSVANYSVAFLIGFQSFRIIVELLIHQAVSEGIAPPQMTWSGLNFDIVTGITALLLIPFANKLPVWAVHVWNTMGFGLLLLVVVVAILSMPTAFQQIGPDNTWVAHFPFVWLPVGLVSFALMGHIILFRKMLAIGRREV